MSSSAFSLSLQFDETASYRPTALLVGVAYKPGVADTRETPAAEIARALVSAGLNVEFVDPLVSEFEVDGVSLIRHDDAVAAAAASDIAVIHTPHADFDLDRITGSAPMVFDTRGVVDAVGVKRRLWRSRSSRVGELSLSVTAIRRRSRSRRANSSRSDRSIRSSGSPVGS